LGVTISRSRSFVLALSAALAASAACGCNSASSSDTQSSDTPSSDPNCHSGPDLPEPGAACDQSPIVCAGICTADTCRRTEPVPGEVRFAECIDGRWKIAIGTCDYPGDSNAHGDATYDPSCSTVGLPSGGCDPLCDRCRAQITTTCEDGGRATTKSWDDYECSCASDDGGSWQCNASSRGDAGCVFGDASLDADAGDTAD
jgi:hypothetical protein